MASNRSWYDDAVAAYGKSAVDTLSANALKDLDQTFGSIMQRVESAMQGKWFVASLLQTWLQNEIQPKIERYIQDAIRQSAEANKPTSVTISSSSLNENSPDGTVVGLLGALNKAGAMNGMKFELVGGYNDSFKIVDGNKIVATKAFNYEWNSSAVLTVKATDANGKSIWQNINIQIKDVNEAPENLQLWWNHVTENKAAGTVINSLYATDPDRNDKVTFSVVGGKDAADFKVVNGNLVTTRALDHEAGATREVTVRATDKGGAYTEKTFTIVVDDTNDRPTDILASNLNLAAGAAKGTVVATLTSVDQDVGDKGRFQIVGSNKGGFQIQGDKLVTTKVIASGSEDVTVRVYDQWGQTFDKTFTIKVGNVIPEPVNNAPTDLSMVSQGIAENSGAGAIVGNLSATDADAGEAFTYKVVGGRDGALFEVVGNKLVAKGPLNYEEGATREVTVQVTDKGGLTFQKTFTVNVLDVNEAPVSLTMAGGSVSENMAAGTVVATLTGSDPDAGAALSYAIVGGRDAASFAVVGDQLVANGPLNYEEGATREVTIRVTDQGGLSYEKTFTLNVLDVNEAPVSLSVTGGTVAENMAAGTVVATLSGMDPDLGEVLAYSIVGGPDAADFQVDGNQIVTARALDFESGATREVIVRATDKGGLTIEKTVLVNVADVNEAPVSLVLEGDLVDENMAAGTVVGSLLGADPDAGDELSFSVVGGRDAADFQVVGSQLVTARPLDYEASASREVVIRVTDKGGLSYDKTFTIQVGDVYDPNRAPESVTLASLPVDENMASGTVVGTVSGTDPDQDDELSFSIVGGSDAASFALVGDKLVTTGPLDFEAGATKEVIIRATDKLGATFDQVVHVQVGDVNETPIAVSLQGGIAENSPVGTVVGSLSASDPDAGDTFTYAIVGGRDAASFAVVGDQLVSTQSFDFEAGASKEIVVRVTDSGGLVHERTITVDILDVNEAPVSLTMAWNGTTRSSDGEGRMVGSLRTDDPDQVESLTYTIVGGKDAGLFALDADGNLYATQRLGYNGGVDREVRVQVADKGGMTITETFTFHVAGEAPTDVEYTSTAIVDRTAAGSEVALLSAIGVDETNRVTYSIVGGPNASEFVVQGDRILLAVDADFAQGGATRSFVLRATEMDGRWYEETLTFEVVRSQSEGGALTGLELSDYAVAEGLPGPHVVANFLPIGVEPGSVTYEVIGGAQAHMFSVNGGGQLVLNDYAWSYDTPTLDVQVRATDGSGNSVVQSFSISTLPVTYLSGAGFLEGTAGSADAFMPDGGTAMNVHGFNEREGDQFVMFLLLGQEDIGVHSVRLVGSDDMSVSVQADFGGGFTEIATLENAISKNGTLNGDNVADALSQQQLDALAADWIANHVIHA